MRELLNHVDSMFAVLLGDIGRLIKELQNRLSRAVDDGMFTLGFPLISK